MEEALIKKENDHSYIVDLIKCLCIIFVITSHSGFAESKRLQLLFPFWIDMAVPVFMIISGYLWTLSNINHNRICVKDLYDVKLLLTKFLRFFIPTIVILLIEQLYIYKSLSIVRGIKFLIFGGRGPGGYYTTIMFQFIFIFPLIYLIPGRLRIQIAFICNLFWEIMVYLINVSQKTYRLIIFRYIFFIAIGSYLATFKKNEKSDVKVLEMKKRAKTNILTMLSIFIGVYYLVSVAYFNKSVFFIKYWKTTSILVGLYIGPIVAFLINNTTMEEWLLKRKKIIRKWISIVSNATFHIFLFQMFFYQITQIPRKIVNLPITVIFNCMFCIIIGCAFYYIEKILKKNCIKIIKKMRVMEKLINKEKVCIK